MLKKIYWTPQSESILALTHSYVEFQNAQYSPTDLSLTWRIVNMLDIQLHDILFLHHSASDSQGSHGITLLQSFISMPRPNSIHNPQINRSQSPKLSTSRKWRNRPHWQSRRTWDSKRRSAMAVTTHPRAWKWYYSFSLTYKRGGLGLGGSEKSRLMSRGWELHQSLILINMVAANATFILHITSTSIFNSLPKYWYCRNLQFHLLWNRVLSGDLSVSR